MTPSEKIEELEKTIRRLLVDYDERTFQWNEALLERDDALIRGDEARNKVFKLEKQVERLTGENIALQAELDEMKGFYQT